MRSFFLPFSALLILAGALAHGQEVVSAHSGVVHFFEGVVLLDNQPLEHKSASFPAMNPNATLRTEKGRAELLLTPGVFLRLDENSGVRMAANSLTGAEIEFLRGSAILDSMDAGENPTVTMTYMHCRIRFPKPGIYRIDSDTGVAQAYSGRLEVTGPGGTTEAVDTNKLYFFELEALTNKFGEPNEDEFYDWARGRADAISAENQLASQSLADPADSDPGSNVFAGSPAPLGTFPPYSGVDNSYGLAGMFFDPFFGFGAGGMMPYNVVPVFLVIRPANWGSRWPHRNPTTISGYAGSRPIAPAPIRIPVFTPRPVSAPSGVRSYRPAPVAAPHPVAPAGIRISH
ncbi:MAG: hypothetical protein JO340_00080 [Acidobacteriaceae bacterium]|nr:hypothetical protein [Acidobacteriaceae bacterium]